MEENDFGGGEEVGQQTGGEGPSASEQEAMGLGWEPQDKWHGKADDWVDADTFLERGRQINAVLKKSLAKEKADRIRMEQELAGLKGTVQELAEYRHNLEKTIYDRTMADLKAQLRAARVDGDIDRVVDVEEALDQLKEQGAPKKPEVKVVPTNQEPPEMVEWRQRNAWYSEENPDMVSYADGCAINIIQATQRAGRQANPADVLREVDARMRKMFPQAFGQDRNAMFEGGGNGGGGNASGKSGGKGFGSLPQQAKQQFEKFYNAGYYIDMKTKKPLDKAAAQAEYFKDYQ